MHVPIFFLFFIISCGTDRNTPTQSAPKWSALPSADASTPVARHEAAFVGVRGKFYLLGGRGIKPVSIYDPVANTWSEGDTSPVEIHHFQPVVYNNEIYLLGAMTGPYPGEVALPNIYIYNPEKDEWRQGAEIPEHRRRGGAGAVLHQDKIYLVCGIRDGHRGDHKSWLDEYDPVTDQWRELPDAPRPRDHFQAVIADGKLYALAGRITVAAQNPFANTIKKVDVYDFSQNSWSTLKKGLPTPRAGNAALVIKDDILILGGESTAHEKAHDEVEALLVNDGVWRKLPPLSRGRHGTGVIQFDGRLYMSSGCGNRGGSPELDDLISVVVED